MEDEEYERLLEEGKPCGECLGIGRHAPWCRTAADISAPINRRVGGGWPPKP